MNLCKIIYGSFGIPYSAFKHKKYSLTLFSLIPIIGALITLICPSLLKSEKKFYYLFILRGTVSLLTLGVLTLVLDILFIIGTTIYFYINPNKRVTGISYNWAPGFIFVVRRFHEAIT